MANSNPTSALLCILNVVQVIFGLAITCVAIWFFVEVTYITNLRNSNHYLLDYNVYWPQAIPWIFILAGLLVICVSGCGIVGARRKSSGFVYLYLVFEVIAVLALAGAAIVALTLADTKASADFMKDAVWDIFSHMSSDPTVEVSFGNFERRFQCCGAEGPRDYISIRRDLSFPPSCCDTYYHGFLGSVVQDCNTANKAANERYGCAKVIINYTSIIIRILAGGAVFTAFIGIMNMIVGFTLSKSIKKRNRVPVQLESESKKVLL